MNSILLEKGFDYSKNRRNSQRSHSFVAKSEASRPRLPEGWKPVPAGDSELISRTRVFLVEPKLHFELTKDISLAIPARLESLMAELEHSKYILDFRENWDDEGSKPYNPETLKAAIVFLCRYLISTLDRCGSLLLPKIYHGPEGSIDLLWDSESFSLLINIDVTGTIGQFSGEILDDANLQSGQGNFNVNCRTFEFLPTPATF